MILHAFAKINWSLDITGIREDGYHLMDMLMQPISLHDEISLRLSPELSITTGGFPPSRADETNLAYRAAAALKKETGYPGGAAVHVRKTIPIGAGMGGGSADAAAVLYGLNLLWETGLPRTELERIGLTLGADVPFFFRGGLTRTGGIGELLEEHECKRNFWLVLIQPCPGLSTGRVFSLWKQEELPARPETDAALAALETGNLPALCKSIGNVLQPVASRLRPEISEACRSLQEEQAVTACMTGSGSAVFGVFRNAVSAEKAFRRLSLKYRTVFLSHTQHDSLLVIKD